jgi:hypothetical protein
MRKKGFIGVALITIGLALASSANCADSLVYSVQGLWRLMGVMPAGVPSEEVPDRLDGFLCYWFHDDGTVTMLTETRDGRGKQSGRWKQKGRTVVIIWETGMRQSVQVVRNEGDSLFLAGFGARPVWFRFTRFF